jgi:hypothetical protein
MKVIDGQMEQLILHGDPAADDIASVFGIDTGGK